MSSGNKARISSMELYLAKSAVEREVAEVAAGAKALAPCDKRAKRARQAGTIFMVSYC